jgi:cytochrome c-type biogenesis protein CcmH/NrfG
MTLEESLASAIAQVNADHYSSENWYTLGRLMATAGYPDRARDCFTRAVALDPDAKKPGARPTPFHSEMPDWWEAADRG